jgi:hypothetical protein
VKVQIILQTLVLEEEIFFELQGTYQQISQERTW